MIAVDTNILIYAHRLETDLRRLPNLSGWPKERSHGPCRSSV